VPKSPPCNFDGGTANAQVLLYVLKKHIDFMEGLFTPEVDMLVPGDDKVGLLVQLSSVGRDEVMDVVIAALGQGEEDDS
jgi:hypothetical protein